MSGIKQADIEELRRAIEKEFQNDPALQQVHIARKTIDREAELRGLSFLEYVRLLAKDKETATPQD
ncbi:MAG: hypothetical protein HYY29_04430 [Chloroflexi bacterium]|nr:hypothetical protein [Chloroflexota bacterium]